MQKLNEQLESIDVANEYSNACIYTYIEDNILPFVGSDACAPPGLLIYSARRLFEPTLLCEDIPTLLDILANVEAIRRRALEQARTALNLQQKLVELQRPREQLPRQPNMIPLRVMADQEMDESTRLLLREDVVFNLCRIHLCHLWTSPDAYIIGKTMRRLFPSNYVRNGDPFADEHWRSALHHDLTYAERERVHAVGEEMKNFLSTARAWDLERKSYFENLGLKEDVIFGEGEFLSYSRDFNAKFRSPIDEHGMMTGLNEYLKEVQRIVNTMEKLFPNAQQKAEQAAATLLARQQTRDGRSKR